MKKINEIINFKKDKPYLIVIGILLIVLIYSFVSSLVENIKLNAALDEELKAYKKLVSPFLIRSCRYHPTCSEYASEAIEKFGAFRGTLIALGRLLRCHPFARGGFDPCPEPEGKLVCKKEC